MSFDLLIVNTIEACEYHYCTQSLEEHSTYSPHTSVESKVTQRFLSNSYTNEPHNC